ncbi:MAG: biotin--[acetyl-CoA-carboxylase] ligase [Jatrophihabitantaceae bacterium]
MERAPIDVEALHSALDDRWARVEVIEEADSTNATLLRDTEAPDRSVLVAEHQIAGRGRLERTWESPARAGLTFSVLLRPAAPVAGWGWLPLLTGLAVHDALTRVAGAGPALKWPNDVLCGPAEAKVAGILAQTADRAVVVGVGLNVTTTREELPVDTATSLALCGAHELDRAVLLIAILRRLDDRLERFEAARGDAAGCGLDVDYRQACATIGRDVTVSTTTGATVTGRAVGIDRDGRLLVDRDGSVEAIGAGDVEHLRPAG